MPTAAGVPPGSPAERAFLAEICAGPADDTPRLIFADFLEEHGDEARAEFIRVQCELARIGLLRPPADDEGRAVIRRWHVLRRRERRLLLGHFRAWAPNPYGNGFSLWPDDRSVTVGPTPVVNAAARLSFRRGFVARVEMPAADFLRHAAALFACQPVKEVRLSDKSPLTWSHPRPLAAWVCDRVDEIFDVPHDLPRVLWDRLATPPDISGRPVKHYTDTAEALADLSRAAVAFGRGAARLPPLLPL